MLEELASIVGVQFRRAGKIYDFLSGDHSIRIGESVVVDTDRGMSLAEVVQVKFANPKSIDPKGLKPIVRIASGKDLDNTGSISEREMADLCNLKIKDLKLDMRILKAEAQFGGSKIILYFSSPGRIDFRDLVKQLAGILRARVELKQVGARDETKILGGLGICGREFCCSSFLREFVPVSIKMAKNQNLALNPTKVSGGCGRLLCCLTYENDLYTELRSKLPPLGAMVAVAPDMREAKVRRTDLLNQICVLEFEDGSSEKHRVQDLTLISKKAPRSSKQEDPNENVDDSGSWGEDIDLSDLMD